MSDDDLIRRGDALAAVKAIEREHWRLEVDAVYSRSTQEAYRQNHMAQSAAECVAAIAALPAVTVGVKWRKIETAPRGGEWFIARTERGTTRVVHYADEYDRLPISHDGVVWPTTPTEWTPLKPALAALDMQPDQDMTDPVTVHANMLRGSIAKPSVDQIIHLYGVDALCKALAPMIVQEASTPEGTTAQPTPDAQAIREAAQVLLDAMTARPAKCDPFDPCNADVERLAIQYSSQGGDAVVVLETAEKFMLAGLRALIGTTAEGGA